MLLLEAGPDDADDRVSDPDRWVENLGTERDWGYVSTPGAGVDQRRLFIRWARASVAVPNV